MMVERLKTRQAPEWEFRPLLALLHQLEWARTMLCAPCLSVLSNARLQGSGIRSVAAMATIQIAVGGPTHSPTPVSKAEQICSRGRRDGALVPRTPRFPSIFAP